MSKLPGHKVEELLPGGQIAKGRYRRPWIWRVGVCFGLIVIVAVIVPIAVILSRRHNSYTPVSAPKSNVIVPLYAYPSQGAWEPLYTAVNASSSLNFTVVINPDNGPGANTRPDDNYVSAVTKLRAFSNVRLLGYIPTTQGTRSYDSILAALEIYSGWAQNDTAFAVDGIFFDEAPQTLTDSNYTPRLSAAVANTTGVQRERLVVFNPGVIPENGVYNVGTDVVISVETSYSVYESTQTTLDKLPLKRDQYGFIIHSVPSSASLSDLVSNMAQHANYLYVTDKTFDGNETTSNPYDGFGSDWQSFVGSMPK